MKKNLNFEGEIFNPKEIETLYHVGSMDISQKSLFAIEGNGLSVSICPKDWMKIAKMKDSTIWKLYKKNIKMLDYHSLTENDFNLATSWGITEGYLKEFEVYSVTKFDDDMNCDLHSIHDTFEDALNKASIEEKYDTFESYISNRKSLYPRIEKIKGYKPTKKLNSLSMVNVDIQNSKQINLLLFLEKNTDLDGVYWNEELNLSKNSAPKGVIFNSKINDFSKSIVHFCESCEKTVAEYEIHDKKICSHCKDTEYGKDKFNSNTNYYTCSICGEEYFFGFGKCSCHKYINK